MTNQEYVTSLRALADLIESCELELDLSGETVNVIAFSTEEMAGKVKAIGGTFRKLSQGSWFVMRRDVGKFNIDIFAAHERVCERVVVGTETVEVPDPAAPTVMVEREIVEWKCPTVLESA